MSDALVGTGIVLSVGDGATPTEAFAPVAEMVSLKPPPVSRNEVDVTSVSVDQSAMILGILRYGQVTGTCNWVGTDATHQAIHADIIANIKRNWRIACPPDGFPQITFPARVQQFEPQEVGVDTALQFAFALSIDGAVEWLDEAEP